MSIAANLINDLYSRRTIKPGLQRIKKLLNVFSVKKIPFKVIHIAGTNGKGSTATMISQILKGCKKRTGLFISPHLSRINERISINGKSISDKDFTLYAKKIRNILLKKEPLLLQETTFFEYITLLSVLYFIDKKVEWAVYETGMGGRLDATNIFPSKICVITNISKEHSAFLGKTKKKIALEKFAIIKAGAKTITAVEEKLCTSTLKILGKNKMRSFLIDKDFSVTVNEKKGFYHKLQYSDSKNSITFEYIIKTPLKIQCNNSAMAIKASYEALKGAISKEKFVSVCKKVLKKNILRGRFQVFGKKRLVIVDVSHNPASINALVDTILHLDVKSKWCIIFCVLEDKEYKLMFESLGKITKDFVFTEPVSERALNPYALKNKLGKNVEKCKIIIKKNIEDAFFYWKEKKASKNCIICGSFFVAGPALKILENSFDKR